MQIRRLGATVRELSQITGLNSSNIRRRRSAATSGKWSQHGLYDPVELVIETYKKLEYLNAQ